MPSVYDNDNFAGRVNYAATLIARKGAQTRHFDTCFEMYDGIEVAVAVYRRSLRNPKLAANIWTYLGRDLVMSNVETLKEVATRDLPARRAVADTREDGGRQDAGGSPAEAGVSIGSVPGPDVLSSFGR